MDRTYYVYIMTNRSNRVLYTGVTSDLQRRVHQHRSGTGSQFTSRYRCYKLVYFEQGESVSAAIAREKQIKAGSRARKVALIQADNPNWVDLAAAWF